MRNAVLISLCLIMTGCSATFKTGQFDVNNWKPVGEQVEGVVYYEPHQVKIITEHTEYIDSNTGLKMPCEKVLVSESIVIEPNLSKPRVLLNQPSPFASSVLKIDFKDGMITSINSESKPVTADLINAITNTVDKLQPKDFMPQRAQPAVPKDKIPACTSGVTIRKIGWREIGDK